MIAGNVPSFVIGFQEENASGLYGDIQWRAFTLDLKQIQKTIEKLTERKILADFWKMDKISEFPDIQFGEVSLESGAQRHDALRADAQAKLLTRSEFRNRINEDLDDFGDDRDDEFVNSGGGSGEPKDDEDDKDDKPIDRKIPDLSGEALSENWKVEDGKYNLYRDGKIIHTQDVSLKINVKGILTNTIDQLISNYPFPSIIKGIDERESESGVKYVKAGEAGLDELDNYVYLSPKLTSRPFQEIETFWQFQINRAWAEQTGNNFDDNFLRNHRPKTDGDQVNGWIRTGIPSGESDKKKEILLEKKIENRPEDNAELDRLEEEFARVLDKTLDEQKTEIIRRLRTMSNHLGREALNNSLFKAIAALPIPDIFSKVEEFIRRAVTNGLETAGKKLNKNFDPDEQAINFLSTHTFENVKDMTSEISNDLRRELETGLLNGEGVAKLSNRIKEVFNSTRARADTIARTEINRASNEGRLKAYEESGLDGKVQWVSHIDGRTSQVCRDLNKPSNNTRTMSGTFDSKFLKHPIKAPPAHPNCRSTIIFKPEA